MPTYDYHCPACGFKTEIFQKISDSPQKTCPKCHQETFKRGPGGGIGLLFQGTGFYKTDYANSNPSECCPCNKYKKDCNSSQQDK